MESPDRRYLSGEAHLHSFSHICSKARVSEGRSCLRKMPITTRPFRAIVGSLVRELYLYQERDK